MCNLMKRIGPFLVIFFALSGAVFQTGIEVMNQWENEQKQMEHERYIDEVMSFRLTTPQYNQY